MTDNDSIVVRTEHLTRALDGKLLVDNVSIEVRQGQSMAIIGPSGAGKSSLLRLINRLDEPTSGTVYIHSHDYKEIAPQQLRRTVGLVMQDANLFPGTVGENVGYGPLLAGHRLTDGEIEAYLEQVELAGYADRMVDSLSGGEAQRVSIARTLANQPEVLLLDEPTSALDDATKQEVESVIFEIVRSENLTCLMITHDLQQAQRVASQIVHMQDGQVVRTDTARGELDAD